MADGLLAEKPARYAKIDLPRAAVMHKSSKLSGLFTNTL
jgi:hypothetical protein